MRLLGLLAALRCAIAVGPVPVAAAADTDEPGGLPAFTQVEAPTITGVRRFGRSLVAEPGRWSPTPTRRALPAVPRGRGAAGCHDPPSRDPSPETSGLRLAVRWTVSHPERTTASV